MTEVILKNLVTNGEYFAKVYQHIKPEHFESSEQIEIFNAMHDYVLKYDAQPNIKELGLFIKNTAKLSDSQRQDVIVEYKSVMTEAPVENEEFLLEETEKYIQKMELSDAIFRSAEIIEQDMPFEGVIGLVENALSVTFDTDTGMNFGMSAEDRFAYYTQTITGFKLGIRSVDIALGGGLRRKTLNVAVAPSHGGKSALLVASAAEQYLQKEDVLFVSLEMPENEIARRIDANLLNVQANDLGKMRRDEYTSRLSKIDKDAGRIVVKDYSAGTFSVLTLKSLLSELNSKDGFDPSVIIIDYIGLMASSRVSLAQSGGSYAYFKAIAEELHGFAKKFDKALFTAAQLNRGAYDNLDSGLDSIADSLGVIQTADTVIAILSNGQLREYNQALFKFLKNRNTGKLTSHLVEVDFGTTRYTDLDDGPTTASGDQKDAMESLNSSVLQAAVDKNKPKENIMNFD